MNGRHARDVDTDALLYLADGTPVTNGSYATVIVYPQNGAGPVWWDPQHATTSDHPPADMVTDSTFLQFTAIDPLKEPPMPDLETREQVESYLAEYTPSRTYQTHPFEYGWVVVPVLTPEQTALGAARMFLDKATGILWTYPSWSIPTVRRAVTEWKRTGVKKAGNQVYPHRWRIDLMRIRQDDRTIEYEMTVTSLADPSELAEIHPLTLENDNYLHEPRDSMSALASAHLRRARDDNQGIWPEQATTYR